MLSDLNSKEFVDQGLRNTLGSIKKPKINNSYASNMNNISALSAASRTSTRSIAAMARP